MFTLRTESAPIHLPAASDCLKFYKGSKEQLPNMDPLYTLHIKASRNPAVKIQTFTATNLLNSKAEHRQPALLRVRMVRENDDNIQRTGQGRGGVKRRRDV